MICSLACLLLFLTRPSSLRFALPPACFPFHLLPAAACRCSMPKKERNQNKQTHKKQSAFIHQRINNSCFSSRRSRPLPHPLLTLSRDLPPPPCGLSLSLSPSLWPPLSPPLHLASLLINAAVLERRAEDREADSRAVAGPDCDIRAAEPGRGAALGMRRRH